MNDRTHVYAAGAQFSPATQVVPQISAARVRTPRCSPERETETLMIGFSDMMCDVGNAAIKDAIANIARNREVLHFLSCIARFLGHFSGLPTIRSSGFPPRNAPNSIRRTWGVFRS